MGLFSGGGFLGKVGGVLGINTSAQQKAISKAAGAVTAGLEQGIGEIRGSQAATLAELQPFATAGTTALPGFEAGATLQGFGQNIEDIFSSDVFDSLISERERAAGAAFGAAGLTRSGGAIREAANIPTDLAFQIEQLLSGRQGELVGLGQSAATDLAGIRSSDAASIANLLSGQGEARSSSTLGQAQAKQQKQENILGLLTGGLQAFGGLSDIRLKTNIKHIANVGGLMLCEWEWIEGVEDLLKDTPLMNIGFIAQDVEALYPQFSGETHGFKTIDYEGLIIELSKEVH